jgi:ATP-dependent RNA helicase DDX3X
LTLLTSIFNIDLFSSFTHQSVIMSGWGMPEVAAALPEVAPAAESTDIQSSELAETAKNPQEHGWVQKTGYDYNTYNKSTKELAEAAATAAEAAADDANADVDAGMGVQVSLSLIPPEFHESPHITICSPCLC